MIQLKNTVPLAGANIGPSRVGTTQSTRGERELIGTFEGVSRPMWIVSEQRGLQEERDGASHPLPLGLAEGIVSKSGLEEVRRTTNDI